MSVISGVTSIGLLGKVAFEEFALGAFEAADGFFLDLAHAFAGQVEFNADLLEGHFLTADAEEEFDNLAFAVVELKQGALNFG